MPKDEDTNKVTPKQTLQTHNNPFDLPDVAASARKDIQLQQQTSTYANKAKLSAKTSVSKEFTKDFSYFTQPKPIKKANHSHVDSLSTSIDSSQKEHPLSINLSAMKAARADSPSSSDGFITPPSLSRQTSDNSFHTAVGNSPRTPLAKIELKRSASDRVKTNSPFSPTSREGRH